MNVLTRLVDIVDRPMEQSVDIADTEWGFSWAASDGHWYLRNDAGELRRVSDDAFELLYRLAAGSLERDELPETASEIIDSLEANGFLRQNEPIVELHPPDDMRLWPRLLAFVVLYVVAVPVGIDAFTSLLPLTQLLTPMRLGGVFALGLVSIGIHESGHYLAAKPELDPTVRLGRLNGVIPAIITDTTGSWLLPRNRRLWISLAGPFVHLLFTYVLIAVKLLVAPDSFVLNAVIVGNLAQILSTMNPLIHGDGYLLLVDIFDINEPKTRGIEDLRTRTVSPAAVYVVLSYGFGVLSMVWAVFFVITFYVLG